MFVSFTALSSFATHSFSHFHFHVFFFSPHTNWLLRGNNNKQQKICENEQNNSIWQTKVLSIFFLSISILFSIYISIYISLTWIRGAFKLHQFFVCAFVQLRSVCTHMNMKSQWQSKIYTHRQTLMSPPPLPPSPPSLSAWRQRHLERMWLAEIQIMKRKEKNGDTISLSRCYIRAMSTSSPPFHPFVWLPNGILFIYISCKYWQQ